MVKSNNDCTQHCVLCFQSCYKLVVVYSLVSRIIIFGKVFLNVGEVCDAEHLCITATSTCANRKLLINKQLT